MRSKPSIRAKARFTCISAFSTRLARVGGACLGETDESADATLSALLGVFGVFGRTRLFFFGVISAAAAGKPGDAAGRPGDAAAGKLEGRRW